MVILIPLKKYHKISRRPTQHTACMPQLYCSQTAFRQLNHFNEVVRLRCSDLGHMSEWSDTPLLNMCAQCQCMSHDKFAKSFSTAATILSQHSLRLKFILFLIVDSPAITIITTITQGLSQCPPLPEPWIHDYDTSILFEVGPPHLANKDMCGRITFFFFSQITHCYAIKICWTRGSMAKSEAYHQQECSGHAKVKPTKFWGYAWS